MAPTNRFAKYSAPEAEEPAGNRFAKYTPGAILEDEREEAPEQSGPLRKGAAPPTRAVGPRPPALLRLPEGRDEEYAKGLSENEATYKAEQDKKLSNRFLKGAGVSLDKALKTNEMGGLVDLGAAALQGVSALPFLAYDYLNETPTGQVADDVSRVVAEGSGAPALARMQNSGAIKMPGVGKVAEDSLGKVPEGYDPAIDAAMLPINAMTWYSRGAPGRAIQPKFIGPPKPPTSGLRGFVGEIAPHVADATTNLTMGASDLAANTVRGGANIAGRVAKAATSGMTEPPDRAAYLANRALKRDNVTTDMLRAEKAKLDKMGGGIEETFPELSGKNARGLARVLASTPGEGADAAQKLATMRREQLGGQAGKALGKATGQDATKYSDDIEELIEARKQASAPAYDAFYASPVDEGVFTRKIRPVLDTDPGKDALNRAKRALAFEAQTTLAAGDKAGSDSLANAAREIDAYLANGAPLGPRALDAVKKGFDDIIDVSAREGGKNNARLLGTAKRNLAFDIDSATGGTYGNALGTYSGPTRIREMIDIGRKAMTMKDWELNEVLKGSTKYGTLTGEEIEGLSKGLTRAFQDAINENDRAFLSKFLRNKGLQNKLQAVIGDDKAFKQFRNQFLRISGRVQHGDFLTQGSPTARIAAEQADAAGEDFGTRFLSNVERGQGLKESVVSAVWKPIVGKINEAYRLLRYRGVGDEEVNKTLTRYLIGTTNDKGVFQPNKMTEGKLDELIVWLESGQKKPQPKTLVSAPSPGSSGPPKAIAGPPSTPPSPVKPPVVKNGFFGGGERLDMSEPARMGRAREQGFDVDTPLYHGTDRAGGFSEFDPKRFDQTTGKGTRGFYFTSSPKHAATYSGSDHYGIIKTYIKPGKQLDLDWNGAWSEKRHGFKNTDDAVRQAEKRGYDSVRIRNVADYGFHNGGSRESLGHADTVVVFDPKNIRRTDAAFDPAESQSSRLLAGFGGGSGREFTQQLLSAGVPATLASIGPEDEPLEQKIPRMLAAMGAGLTVKNWGNVRKVFRSYGDNALDAFDAKYGPEQIAKVLKGEELESFKKVWGLDQPKSRGAEGADQMTFGGINAKTADKQALAQAEKMEKAGASPDEIWSKTGWGKNAGGVWEFEISDQGAKMLPPIDYSNTQGWTAARGSGKDKGRWIVRDQHDRPIGNVSAEADRTPEHAIETVSYNWRRMSPQRSPQTQLENVMGHPELYKAYPDMRKVLTGTGDHPTNFGLHDEVKGSPWAENIYASGPDQEGVRSVMLHEIDHGIQGRENFPRGAAPPSNYNEFAERFAQLTPEQKRGVDSEARRLFEESKTKHPERGLSGTWDELNGGDRLDFESLAIYRIEAGEVAARNVQTRDAMRRRGEEPGAPWETEDVPRKDQIVRFGSGKSESRGPPEKPRPPGTTTPEQDLARAKKFRPLRDRQDAADWYTLLKDETDLRRVMDILGVDMDPTVLKLPRGRAMVERTKDAVMAKVMEYFPSGNVYSKAPLVRKMNDEGATDEQIAQALGLNPNDFENFGQYLDTLDGRLAVTSQRKLLRGKRSESRGSGGGGSPGKGGGGGKVVEGGFTEHPRKQLERELNKSIAEMGTHAYDKLNKRFQKGEITASELDGLAAGHSMEDLETARANMREIMEKADDTSILKLRQENPSARFALNLLAERGDARAKTLAYVRERGMRLPKAVENLWRDMDANTMDFARLTGELHGLARDYGDEIVVDVAREVARLSGQPLIMKTGQKVSTAQEAYDFLHGLNRNLRESGNPQGGIVGAPVEKEFRKVGAEKTPDWAVQLINQARMRKGPFAKPVEQEAPSASVTPMRKPPSMQESRAAPAEANGLKSPPKGPPKRQMSKTEQKAREELKVARAAYTATRKRNVMDTENRDKLNQPFLEAEHAASERLRRVLENEGRMRTVGARTREVGAKALRHPIAYGAGAGVVGSAGLIGLSHLGPPGSDKRGAPVGPNDPRYYWTTIKDDGAKMRQIQHALSEWQDRNTGESLWPEDAQMTGFPGKTTMAALRKWRFDRGLDPDASMSKADISRLLAGDKGYQDERNPKVWRYGDGTEALPR